MYINNFKGDSFMKLRKIITGVIIILLAFTQYGTAFSEKMKKTSCNSVKVSAKQIKYKTKNIQIDMQIPILCGMKDKVYQNSLNKEIVSKLLKTKQQMEKESKEFGNYEYRVTYMLTRSGNRFSLGITSYYYTGGAHGSSGTEYYNIVNESKAGRFYITDLFKPESNYIEIINSFVKDRIKENRLYYSENEEIFRTIEPDRSFYLDGDKLVICFAEYEIAPYSAGSPQIPISLSMLKSILKINS